AVAPDGKWILFGSDRSGVMQLYVATADGTESWPVTNVPAGSCAMHGHWQPVVGTKPGGPEKAIPQEQPSGITPREVENTGSTRQLPISRGAPAHTCPNQPRNRGAVQFAHGGLKALSWKTGVEGPLDTAIGPQGFPCRVGSAQAMRVTLWNRAGVL